jgi:hypothetical protein
MNLKLRRRKRPRPNLKALSQHFSGVTDKNHENLHLMMTVMIMMTMTMT